MSDAVCSGGEDIIKKSTEAPGTFVFAELLDNPAVKALCSIDQSKHIALLKLFCYGTYDDYKASLSTFPPLSFLQLRKLRQLTIISACYAQKLIPYTQLLKQLELGSLRELEDLIIELFYLEVVCGKLDQQNGLLLVESAIGRDLREDELPKLNAALNQWCNRVEEVFYNIAGEMGKAARLKQTWDADRAACQKQAIVSLEADTIDTALKGEVGLMDIDECFGNSSDSLSAEAGGGVDNNQPRLASLMAYISQIGNDKDTRWRRNPLHGLKHGRKGK